MRCRRLESNYKKTYNSLLTWSAHFASLSNLGPYPSTAVIVCLMEILIALCNMMYSASGKTSEFKTTTFSDVSTFRPWKLSETQLPRVLGSAAERKLAALRETARNFRHAWQEFWARLPGTQAEVGRRTGDFLVTCLGQYKVHLVGVPAYSNNIE